MTLLSQVDGFADLAGARGPARLERSRLARHEPVTQTGHVKTITASELKARLLAVLDEVERTGEVIVVTKRGREVARLVGPAASAAVHPQDELLGSVTEVGDILAPIGVPEDWAALAGASLVAEPPAEPFEEDSKAGKKSRSRKGRK